jgi:hypothetical protein
MYESWADRRYEEAVDQRRELRADYSNNARKAEPTEDQRAR